MKTREGSERGVTRTNPQRNITPKINGACLNKFKQVLYFVVTTVLHTIK